MHDELEAFEAEVNADLAAAMPPTRPSARKAEKRGRTPVEAFKPPTMGELLQPPAKRARDTAAFAPPVDYTVDDDVMAPPLGYGLADHELQGQKLGANGFMNGGKVKKEKKRKNKKSKKHRKRHSSSSSTSSSSASTPRVAGQVFHVPPKGPSDPSPEGLMDWAERYPGEIAVAMLKRMQGEVHKDGERAFFSATELPIVAKSYYLNRLTHKLKDNRRNKREVYTLCTILDHLAKGKYSAYGPRY